MIPARISADLQAQLRGETFVAFSRASWGEQSRDREGHLQELVTNQIAQATMGSFQATQLIVALTSLLVLLVSALALNVVAAFGVLLAALGLFALLRPLSTVGSRQARAASRASLNYAAGVNEAVRVAEETRVFDVAGAQRQKIGGLVRAVQIPFFRMQVIFRLVPGIYQSLIYLLVAGALALLYVTGTGRIASLGAVVLLLVRAGTYGQQVQAFYTSVRQALPYLLARPRGTAALWRQYSTPRPTKASGRERACFGTSRVCLRAWPDDTFGYHFRGLPRRRWA